MADVPYGDAEAGSLQSSDGRSRSHLSNASGARSGSHLSNASGARSGSHLSNASGARSRLSNTSGSRSQLSNVSGSSIQSDDDSLHNQLSQLIALHSKQLEELVNKLRVEKETADSRIREKDDEIRTLKGELQVLRREVADLRAQSNNRPLTRAPSAGATVATGLRLKPNTTLFRGMERGDSLYTFIDNKLRPNRNFNKQCLEIIDRLVRSIQAKESPFNVKRIVKSGSLGKGTHVRNKSDIDLIIFFNGYKSVQELQTDKASLLQKLKDYIQKDWSSHLLFKDMTPFSVQFYLKVQEEDKEHEVDLLPAYDITKTGRQLAEIYTEMKELPSQDRDPYSSCFSPLQLEFVTATNRVSTPGKVKDLIRLLKYWAKDEEVPVRSYFLELLVVHLWREGGCRNDINMEDYLLKILNLLVDCQNMAISFTDNYNYMDFKPDQRKPFLLDPANPFRNVAPFSQRETDNVSRKAKILLERGWGE